MCAHRRTRVAHELARLHTSCTHGAERRLLPSLAAPLGRMKRTFCAAAADGRDFFDCGRAWAVHAALCAARDAGAAIVVMPYVGGGLYAGPHNMEPDLKRRFVQSVNDMLRPVSGTSEGRMPSAEPG